MSQVMPALRAGDIAAAEAACQQALELAPDHPVALNFAGLCAHGRGDLDRAVALIERAVRIAPDYVEAANNLGNILLQRGARAKAEGYFRQVIAYAPDFAPAHNNLGVLLALSGRHAAAIEAFRRALSLDPSDDQTHENLGDACRHESDVEGAIAAYEECLRLRGGRSDRGLFNHLARLHHFAGHLDLAVRTIDRWLAAHPGDAEAVHMRAAYTGEGVPERASDASVQTIFDAFAGSFEATLAGLGYQTPGLVAAAAAALADRDGARPRPWDVLDAGCGTGLCGPLLRPLARRLVGVDLSPRMVEQARAKGVYDELVVAELGAELERRPAGYDLVVSADTLVYFGDLTRVCQVTAAALRERGAFLFSVEQAPAGGAPFRLHAGGRYAHSEAHVRQALAAAGFAAVSCDEAVVRRENGVDVRGLIVAATR